jgi:hypothetical protein
MIIMKKNLFLVSSIICLTLTSDLAFAAFSVTLTPSNHHGYAVSCFGGRDGAINITVNGGTSPYTYRWSTGATTQNVGGLAAGYYQVTVTDAGTATCTGNVTLTEPTAMTLSIVPSTYSPQTTNISCYNCCNGYINITAGGGVTAYTYSWSSGQTTANITNLCRNTFTVTVTDANGCAIGGNQAMTEPDKDTWTMTGNAGSNPSTQFVGTTDNRDLVFKTNNSEGLRIKANGELKINSLSGADAGMLYTDADGYLWSSAKTISPICNISTPLPVWRTLASPQTIYTCPLIKVGIGTSDVPSNYLFAVRGDIIAEKVNVQLYAAWPDYVFKKDYKLLSLESLEKFVNENHHLPDMPAADEIEKNGQDLGDIQAKLLKINEELTLRIIELNKRIEKLENEKNK